MEQKTPKATRKPATYKLVLGFIALFFIIAALAFALSLTDIGCPLKYATGIPCPSCGMTRAWYAAFHLNFESAIAYHPLFWFMPMALAFAFFLPYANKKLFVAVMVGALILIIGVWVLRLAYTQGVIPELFFPVDVEVMKITEAGWTS